MLNTVNDLSKVDTSKYDILIITNVGLKPITTRKKIFGILPINNIKKLKKFIANYGETRIKQSGYTGKELIIQLES